MPAAAPCHMRYIFMHVVLLLLLLQQLGHAPKSHSPLSTSTFQPPQLVTVLGSANVRV